MKTVAIIGAGASGIACSIEAKRIAKKLNIPCEVVLYEGLNRIGKKLLVTGNGKCNLLNESTDTVNYNGDKELIEGVFSQYSKDSNVDFFRSMGLITKTQQAGRIYPISNQATAVLDALRFETERLNIKTVTGCKITSIKRQNDGFLLNDSFCCDVLIFAFGGMSSPSQGSDGSGFKFLKEMNIPLKKCVPALTPIVLKNQTKALKGIRADGTVEIIFDNKTVAKSKGEIQFTEYGLSGIPTMDVSYSASRLCSENKKCYAKVSLLEDLSTDELTDFFVSRQKYSPELLCENVMCGVLNKNLGIFKLKECGISPTEKIKNLTIKEIKQLANTVKEQIFEIKEVKDFTFSQVTNGGCEASSVNNNLECKNVKNLFLCGELLDVDGKCGGYNLAWAISSGRLAGSSAVKTLNGDK